MDYKEKVIALLNSQELSKEQKEKLESIFPELKESEDERIRQDIVTYLKSVIANKGYKDKIIESWIAWLEKQGEKTEPIEGFDTEFERQISHLVASIINKEYSYTKAFVKWTSGTLLNYAKHEIEKQGEQKSAWSQNDERIYQSIMDDTVQENQLNDKQTNWLEDIKYRYFPQPKQEWSEEDESLRLRTIGALETCKIGSPTKCVDEQIDWLKSLKGRVQPKQEWSEDDKKILDGVITNYESGYLPSVEKRDEIIEKLKALKDRYTWKPSYEQMDMLAKVCSTLHLTSGENEIMESLYDGLKKLRGE